MRSVIIHNPMSGFGSDAIFEFERAMLATSARSVRSHRTSLPRRLWQTPKTLTSACSPVATAP